MQHRFLKSALVALLLSAGSGSTGSAFAATSIDLKASPLSGFVNDLGQRVTDDSLHQPLRLIVFGYMSCPDVCPLTLAAVHRAMAALGKEAISIDPMFITVDPDRDSVQLLHQYLSAFDPKIRAYRGSDAALERFANSLHVRYWRERLNPADPDYFMSHTANLFLMGRDRRVLAKIAHTSEVDALANAIVTAVHEAIRSPSSAPTMR